MGKGDRRQRLVKWESGDNTADPLGTLKWNEECYERKIIMSEIYPRHLPHSIHPLTAGRGENNMLVKYFKINWWEGIVEQNDDDTETIT